MNYCSTSGCSMRSESCPKEGRTPYNLSVCLSCLLKSSLRSILWTWRVGKIQFLTVAYHSWILDQWTVSPWYVVLCCVWFPCPTSSQGERFQSFIVTRYGFQLNENVQVLPDHQEVSGVCCLLDADQRIGFVLLCLDYVWMRAYYEAKKLSFDMMNSVRQALSGFFCRGVQGSSKKRWDH